MQSYSLNGYLNAVLRRSDKTLLVEGVTDHCVITRLKSERSAELGFEQLGNIDVSGLIQDEKIEGLGKKQVIKLALSEIDALPVQLSNKIKTKLGVLFDREWDGLNIEMQLIAPWTEPRQEIPYFICSSSDLIVQ